MQPNLFELSLPAQRPDDSIASNHVRLRLRVLALSLLALAGCATVPQPLQGNFAALSPAAALAHDATGDIVRWGGTIVATETLSGQTCFQLVARPLNDFARPTDNDHADGRFIACHDGFYEPQVFAKGRSLTVTGRVVDFETRKVGEYDYRQPKVAADVIYLWPIVREVDPYYYGSPYGSPFYDPWLQPWPQPWYWRAPHHR